MGASSEATSRAWQSWAGRAPTDTCFNLFSGASPLFRRHLGQVPWEVGTKVCRWPVTVLRQPPYAHRLPLQSSTPSAWLRCGCRLQVGTGAGRPCGSRLCARLCRPSHAATGKYRPCGPSSLGRRACRFPLLSPAALPRLLGGTRPCVCVWGGGAAQG